MGLFDSLRGVLGGNEDLGAEWFCDGCGVQMNDQPGFTASSGVWTCAACGLDNDVSAGNLVHYGEKPVSDAQRRYIGKIEDLLGETFYGNTSEEASDFIDLHRDRYQAKLHTPYKFR